SEICASMTMRCETARRAQVVAHPLELASKGKVMKNAFSDTKSIWEHAIQEDRKNMAQEVVNLLLDHGIRIRQDDGQLRQVTLSKPSTINSAFVVWLRYDKDDGTQTEDLFRVESGQSIKPYYKGALQREF